MKSHFIFTLSGPDRIGIVEEITSIILKYNGNVDASKMAHLGGEFAILTLVSVPTEKRDELQQELEKLSNKGFLVAFKNTEPDGEQKYKGWLPYRIQVHGADHEGIIHNITRHLAGSGINIENMDTSMVQAPMSGTPLFTMNAVVVVPPNLSYNTWNAQLFKVCDEVNVNCDVTPYMG